MKATNDCTSVKNLLLKVVLSYLFLDSRRYCSSIGAAGDLLHMLFLGGALPSTWRIDVGQTAMDLFFVPDLPLLIWVEAGEMVWQDREYNL